MMEKAEPVRAWGQARTSGGSEQQTGSQGAECPRAHPEYIFVTR